MCKGTFVIEAWLAGEVVMVECRTCHQPVRAVISAGDQICLPHAAACDDGDCPGSLLPGNPINRCGKCGQKVLGDDFAAQHETPDGVYCEGSYEPLQ